MNPYLKNGLLMVTTLAGLQFGAVLVQWDHSVIGILLSMLGGAALGILTAKALIHDSDEAFLQELSGETEND
ncbi:MAG TPA: hypothetical protein VE222_12310 [Nitrospiraceae bacterium]|jgi:hypothetical protein|nr:hypothetical protein [Nitrospiraceae bacterium]